MGNKLITPGRETPKQLEKALKLEANNALLLSKDIWPHAEQIPDAIWAVTTELTQSVEVVLHLQEKGLELTLTYKKDNKKK